MKIETGHIEYSYHYPRRQKANWSRVHASRFGFPSFVVYCVCVCVFLLLLPLLSALSLYICLFVCFVAFATCFICTHIYTSSGSVSHQPTEYNGNRRYLAAFGYRSLRCRRTVVTQTRSLYAWLYVYLCMYLNEYSDWLFRNSHTYYCLNVQCDVCVCIDARIHFIVTNIKELFSDTVSNLRLYAFGRGFGSKGKWFEFHVCALCFMLTVAFNMHHCSVLRCVYF